MGSSAMCASASKGSCEPTSCNRCSDSLLCTGLAHNVLGADVAPDAPLMAAGLDSLGAVELRNAVAEAFGVALPATAALDLPTLDALAARVAARLPLAVGGGDQPSEQAGAGLSRQPAPLLPSRHLCKDPKSMALLSYIGHASALILSLPPSDTQHGPRIQPISTVPAPCFGLSPNVIAFGLASKGAVTSCHVTLCICRTRSGADYRRAGSHLGIDEDHR